MKLNPTPLNPTPLSEFFARHGADFIDIYGVQIPRHGGGVVTLEYQKAREGTLICDGGHRAWIDVHGADVCDFFQRTLASDLSNLNVGEHQLSAMLDGKGRWIAELVLYRFADRDNSWHIGVDIPVACCDEFLQKLDMMHFGEDISFVKSDAARIKILGKLPTINHDGVLISRPDAGVECHEIIIASDLATDVMQQLVDNGHQLGGWSVQNTLRVEGGFPLWGSDFDGNHTLPSCNEWRRASITKGCYAGQEVVARINTYGEAPRQLCQLHFMGEAQLMQGATLFDAEDKKVGNVCSCIFSPQFDKTIAFAFIKRTAAQTGTPLKATLQQATANCEVVMPEKVFG
jgi:folate-binding protein YgfZ